MRYQEKADFLMISLVRHISVFQFGMVMIVVKETELYWVHSIVLNTFKMQCNAMVICSDIDIFVVRN